MNALIDHFPDAGDAALPDRKQLTRIAAGIAISLAVHALLLSSYRQPQPAALPAPATEALTVRLQAAPEKLPAAEPAVPAAQPEPRARPASRPRPARRIVAVPPPGPPSGEEHVKVDTQPEAPRFNLDAARSLARAVAKEPDPASGDSTGTLAASAFADGNEAGARDQGGQAAGLQGWRAGRSAGADLSDDG